MFVPSRYQSAIYDWVEHGEGNAVVEAVAGSGKTTTIVEALSHIPADQRVLFLSFNKHIAVELGNRLKAAGVTNVEASTFHSAGYRIVQGSGWFGRVQLDENKVRRIATNLTSRMSEEEQSQVVPLLVKAVGLFMGTMTDYRDRRAVTETLDRYSIETNGALETLLDLLPPVFAEIRSSGRTICFDEMVYIPAAADMPFPRYDWILVDEGQDLNQAQITVLLKLAKAGNSRVVVVGDRFQSIYGFRGADYRAIPELIRQLSATVLPLSITYRCPASHVAMAKQLVPHLEARDGAPEGSIEQMAFEQAYKAGLFNPEALVMCRMNAPLVELALRLIRRGVPVTVRGRDIGKNLTTLMQKLWDGQDSISEFLAKVAEYRDIEREKLEKRKASDSAIQALDDKIETLYALCDGKADVAAAIRDTIDLFSDESIAGKVTMSSVHRAKGLESSLVLIYRRELMPLPAKTDWERQQEQNIEYVALTRSKDRMVFVS